MRTWPTMPRQSGRRRPVPFEQGTTWAVDYADADGPQQVMEAVRRNVYYGATVIKLVADQKPYFYSEEEIRAAAQEAHRAGLKLAFRDEGGTGRPLRPVSAGLQGLASNKARSD